MAVYRYQVVNVGFWRGKIKRWNTTIHYNDSSSTVFLKNKFQALGWKSAGDVTGACSGGLASITVYNASGGAPIATAKYFDWQTPSTWIPYTGTAWAAVDPDTPLDASGESAVVVVGHMSGLSSTGKPVTTRKYLHAIPSRTATDYMDPDVDAATTALILAQLGVNDLSNPAGVAPATASVEPYYFNHQRVRGRRRTSRTLAGESFSSGVVLGSSACSSGGGGRPFQIR